LPERRLSDIEPARTIAGKDVPIPETDLEVRLDEYRYRRGRTAGGKSTLVKWAKLRFRSAAGEEEQGRFWLDESHEVLGRRLYVTGSRSEVLVYALPQAVEEEE
jgi:hypothetical protein